MKTSNNIFDDTISQHNKYFFQNGKWNGLMAALIAKKFDMVLTSLKINAEREAVVDFTAPFLESGTIENL